MKKLLVGLFAMSALAYGASDNHLYFIGEFTPFANYNVESNNKIGNKDKIHDAEYGFGFEITQDITRDVEAGFGVQYQRHGEFSYNYNYEGKKLPNFNSIPVYVTGKYKLCSVGDWTPYLKGDLGYSFNDLDDNERFSYESGLYYGVAFGVEIQNLSLEFAYKVNEGKVKDTNEKYDIDNKRVMFGAAYKFDL